MWILISEGMDARHQSVKDTRVRILNWCYVNAGTFLKRLPQSALDSMLTWSSQHHLSRH
jgi:hypothetical protein